MVLVVRKQYKGRFLHLQNLFPGAGSSEDFEAAFHKVYDSGEYKQIVNHDDHPRFAEFLGLLDEVLQVKDLGKSLFPKVLHTLRSTCGQSGVLSAAHYIPTGELSTRQEVFASGGSSYVRRGKFVEDSRSKEVCVKVIKFEGRDGEEERKKKWKAFREEVTIWRRLNHPNVVRCVGATDTDPPRIVMDFMENGRVVDYLRSTPNVDRVHLVLGVAQGLEYLHSCGVVHGDVNPRNILVNAEGDACLSDFGLSAAALGDETLEARGYDPAYVAPETLNGLISKETDVYCFGLVVFKVLTGRSPWGQMSTCAIMASSALARSPDQPRDGNPAALELWECLTAWCWPVEPEKRMTISGVRERLPSIPHSRDAIATRSGPDSPTIVPSVVVPEEATNASSQDGGEIVPILYIR